MLTSASYPIQNQPGYRGLKRTIAPTFQPVEISDLRSNAGQSLNDDDLELRDCIEAAADYVEQYQGRALGRSTWQAVYDCFPANGVFYVPMPPLVSVVITYLDTAGASQTLSSSLYTVDIVSEPARIGVAYSRVWPLTLGQIGAVTLTMVCGYAAAGDIPARRRQLVRKLANHSYEYREPIIVGESIASVPYSVQDLLDADRLLRYR